MTLPILPLPPTLLLSLLLPILLLCLTTYLTTLSAYHLSLRRALHQSPRRPPLLPYPIPYLGSTLPFSNQSVGHFWASLRARASHTHLSAFTILLAGKRTHLVFSPAGVTALFRSREVSRAALDRKLGVNVLGMSVEDAGKAFPSRGEGEEEKGERKGEGSETSTARLHAEHLLSSAAVELLTAKFMERFTAEVRAVVGPRYGTRGESLKEEIEGGGTRGDGQATSLLATLLPAILTASTTALFGSALLTHHPTFLSTYRVWEDSLLTLLFGVPRLFAPAAHAARDTCIAHLTSWLASCTQEEVSPDDDDDPDPAWTPTSGARIMRRRHALYAARGLSARAQAGWDLVFLAGILSNATPATGWLLLHIFAPSSGAFRAQVEREVRACVRADGSVDVAALKGAAWLNAGLNEVLRMYVDLLVVRDVDSPTELGGWSVGRGEQVMAPSWMVHRDEALYEDPEEFRPERWIERNEGGEVVCRKEGGGRFFPFGGGHYMCPGRVFARQEVLGAVAVVLAECEVEWVGWVDGKGREVGAGREGFPGIKRGFAGNQVVGIEGDMRVRIRRREAAL